MDIWYPSTTCVESKYGYSTVQVIHKSIMVFTVLFHLAMYSTEIVAVHHKMLCTNNLIVLVQTISMLLKSSIHDCSE